MDRRSFLLAAASGFAGRRLLSAGTSKPPAVQRGPLGWCGLYGEQTQFGWVGGRNGTISYVLVYQNLDDFWGVLRHKTDGVFEDLCNASSLEAAKFAAEQHNAWLPYNLDVHGHFNRVGCNGRFGIAHVSKRQHLRRHARG